MVFSLKIPQLNGSDYLKCLEITSEPSNQAVTSGDSAVIEYIQHEKYRRGTTSLRYLDEPYKMMYSGIIFKNWSPFVKVFNDMLAKMETNGLMAHWRRFNVYSKTIIEDIGPQVLTMDHLKIGFLACCISMVLAVIAFIGELAWSRLVTCCRKNSNNCKKPNQTVKRCATYFSAKYNRTQPQVIFEEKDV